MTQQSCRPRDHLIAAGTLYPDAWKQAEYFRNDREGLPAWPDWCYLPLAGWYSIVSGGGPNQLSIDLVGDVGRLGAMGAWRMTQGIYRFDPTLYQSIVDTPIDGDIPHDVLYRLPEWCVYIETIGMRWTDGSEIYGFFAHLESDANTGRPELRLVIDAQGALAPLPLHLGPWSLAESITRMTDTASQNAMARGFPAVYGDISSAMRPILEPMISLLLYLCSQGAELGKDGRKPANPQPKKTRHGVRTFCADGPTTWDVGVRLGAALRRAYHAQETGQAAPHAGPRPHIRRAHWHGYRSGPKKREDGSDIPTAARGFDLRWMPPIPVNLDDVADLPATVRPVK